MSSSAAVSTPSKLWIGWGALFAALSAAVGAYGAGLYLTTLTGAIPIGLLTPPLQKGLNSQPASIFLHAIASGAALILSGLLMFPLFRRRLSATAHFRLGWTYVGCVAIGSASGIALSRTATGGAVSTAGFATLAVAWAGTTAAAVVARRTRHLSLHARLMSHSAALAFAAVTLRLYLPLAFVFPVPFASVYRVIAWVAWVPNVLAVEVWYRFVAHGKPEALLANMPGADIPKPVNEDETTDSVPLRTTF